MKPIMRVTDGLRERWKDFYLPETAHPYRIALHRYGSTHHVQCIQETRRHYNMVGILLTVSTLSCIH